MGSRSLVGMQGATKTSVEAGSPFTDYMESVRNLWLVLDSASSDDACYLVLCLDTVVITIACAASCCAGWTNFLLRTSIQMPRACHLLFTDYTCPRHNPQGPHTTLGTYLQTNKQRCHIVSHFQTNIGCELCKKCSIKKTSTPVRTFDGIVCLERESWPPPRGCSKVDSAFGYVLGDSLSGSSHFRVAKKLTEAKYSDQVLLGASPSAMDRRMPGRPLQGRADKVVANCPKCLVEMKSDKYIISNKPSETLQMGPLNTSCCCLYPAGDLTTYY